MARPCRCRQTCGSRRGKNPVPLIDLGTLVARFGPVCRRALEAAAGAALSRTRYNVAIKHWLLQLLDAARGIRRGGGKLDLIETAQGGGDAMSNGDRSLSLHTNPTFSSGRGLEVGRLQFRTRRSGEVTGPVHIEKHQGRHTPDKTAWGCRDRIGSQLLLSGLRAGRSSTCSG